ncbi:MAG: alpha/beta hydrolase fold domain-containing protein [Sporomusa sp.]
MKLGKIVWLLVIIPFLFTAGASAAGKGAVSDSTNNKVIDTPIEYPFIKLISNVVYSQVPIRGYDNIALKMDVLVPQQKAPMPAIVYVTGGGFVSANKDNYIQQRMAMAEAGYVVASIEYRVAPTAIFPQPLEDVKAAIRYLKANAAKFNINSDKIGIVGGSAGGYLSAMAGTTSGTRQFDKGENLDQNSEVQAVVDIYGLSDLTRVGADYSQQVQETHKSAGATEALWVHGSPVFGGKDGGILADTDKAKAANPITYISKNTPPFLLLHGDKDTLVSPSQTEILHHALLEQGIKSTRYIVKGAEHGGAYWVQPEVVQVVIDFLDKYLK